MAREFLTDEAVEKEIERLAESEAVKLAMMMALAEVEGAEA